MRSSGTGQSTVIVRSSRLDFSVARAVAAFLVFGAAFVGIGREVYHRFDSLQGGLHLLCRVGGFGHQAGLNHRVVPRFAYRYPGVIKVRDHRRLGLAGPVSDPPNLCRRHKQADATLLPPQARRLWIVPCRQWYSARFRYSPPNAR